MAPDSCTTRSSSIDEFHRRLTIAAAAVLAMYAIGIALKLSFEFFGLPQEALRVGRGLPLWLAPIWLVAIGPVFEEAIFRGVIMRRLLTWRLGFSAAAAISSAAWSAFHLPASVHGAVVYFCLGLILGFVMWRTERLWPCIAAHAAYNAVPAAFIFFFLRQS